MQIDMFSPTEAEPETMNMDPVYREFRRMALELISKGWKRYGAKSIIEVIRFHTSISHGPESTFKINNNRTALYARVFLDEFPEHGGFFETRKSQFD